MIVNKGKQGQTWTSNNKSTCVVYYEGQKEREESTALI